MERNLGYTTIINDGHSNTYSEILRYDGSGGAQWGGTLATPPSLVTATTKLTTRFSSSMTEVEALNGVMTTAKLTATLSSSMMEVQALNGVMTAAKHTARYSSSMM